MRFKKLVSLLTVFMLMMGVISTTALAQPSAGIYLDGQNIYVEGNADGDCQTATLLLKDKTTDAIKYISEIAVDAEGNYSKKFKFKGDIDNCVLYVNDGAENITDTVIKTVTENLKCVGNVDASAFTDGKMTVDVNVKNIYDNEGTCQLFFGFYDDKGRLISAEQEPILYDYYSGTATVTKDVPTGTYKAKAFLWQSLENIIPLAKPDITLPEKDVLLIGDSLGQTYLETDCVTGWGEYIGDYMANGVNVINDCHAGWDTVRYMYDQSGWDKSKTQIGEGDIVIFGLGYNDYGPMGYDGKYCTVENGVRKLYKYGNNSFGSNPTDNIQIYPMTDNVVSIPDVGDIKVPTSVNLETSLDGRFTYLYKDAGGNVQSYAADCFYDNMKVMLDYCKEVGAEVIIRNIAAICSKNAQSMGGTYYAWNTHILINEKCEQLAREYDNVTTIDLFTETKAHFSSLYNSFSEDAPDYAYDADGNLKEYYKNVSDWKLQQLADTYWLTIKNYHKFYKDGNPAQNENGNWGYLCKNGAFKGVDTLHYCPAGANYIASAIAKLAKASDSPVNEYFK